MKQKGFTLFNLIIFMIIIGIIILAALPIPVGYQPSLEYSNSCKQEDLVVDKSGRTVCSKSYLTVNLLQTP